MRDASTQVRRPRRPPLTGWAAAGFALCALALTRPAAAASVSMEGGKVVRWKAQPVPFHLHPAGSADVASGPCLDELRKSFAAWVGPACSSLSFAEQGTSTNLKLIAVGYNENGKNELAWIENSVWTYGKYVLGVTSPLYYTSGKDTAVIIEADIAFNGYQQTWATSGKAYSTDVMNVAVHEIGHFFGLQHNLQPSANQPQTMAPTADPFMGSRTPEQDDIDGLCFLYPKAGSVACSSNAQCPKVVDDGPSGEYYAGQIPCQSGVCAGAPTAITTGAAKIGDACASDADCEKPLFCQPLSGNQAVCSQLCNPSTSGGCPSGFGCVAYQGSGSQGACLAGASGGGGATGKDVGAPCAASADCKSKLCVNAGGGATCQTPCSANAQCPSGQTCQLFAGKAYGACGAAPAGGGGGKLGDGSVCTASSQCASALCVGSAAGATCLADCTSKACVSGFACVALSNGKGACAPTGDGKLGEACAEALDCQGGLCLPSAGKLVCSQPCAANAPCPAGTSCVAVSGGSACLPTQQKGGVGAACDSASECQSNLCVGDSKGGACAQGCSKDSQCGLGWACAPLQGGGGACSKLGDLKGGQACQSPFDCQSGECVDFGKGFACGTPCAGAVDCACGEQCTAFDDEKWCQPGKKLACVADYAPCAAPSECVSDLCLGGKCAPSCSIFGGGASCEDGKGCIRLQADKPEGTCSTSGPEGFGAACTADTGCVSLFCEGGLCGKPCNPFGPNTCPFGLVCAVATGSVGACRAPAPVATEDAGGGADAQAGVDGESGADPDAAAGDDSAGGAGGGPSVQDSATGGVVPTAGNTGGDGGCAALGPGAGGGRRGAHRAGLLALTGALALVARRLRRRGAVAGDGGAVRAV